MDNTNDFRLAMTILARDEADVIEENIRFHAKAGVDKFVVTDNCSEDGTREILDDLSNDFDLTIIDEKSLSIDQDIWVSRMGRWLQDNDSCQWIINNDADEFWCAGTGDLKRAIQQTILTSQEDGLVDVGVLFCPRQNMIGSKEAVLEPGYKFYNNQYSVLKNLMSSCVDTAWNETSGNIVIRKLPGKVITRSEGLGSIAMGNHGATHAGSKVDCEALTILHYPIRSYSQFRTKVVNYGSSLDRNDRFPPNISKHLRFWYECEKQGKLQDQYDLFVLPNDRLVELVEQGVLEEEYRLRDHFERENSFVV